MVTRADIVREAREWLGTPFKWQASRKGVGCDCKGLVFGVARALHMPEAEVAGVDIANYGRAVRPEDLIAGLESALRKVTSPRAGDVISMIVGLERTGLERAVRHLGILSGEGTIIHCYGKGPKIVIEAPIPQHRPVYAYWTWPSLGENAWA